MIINLDVDGVVCDFAPHMFETLKEIYGFDVDSLDPEIYKVWDIFPLMPDEMRKFAFKELMSNPFYWMSIPVVDGAVEGVNKLVEHGHRIHWITSPWASCFGWADARKKWLEKNFGLKDGYKDLTITGDKSFSDADVFVDDKPSSVRDWLSHFSGRKHTGVLYGISHNEREQSEFEYVSNWKNGLADLILSFDDLELITQQGWM